MNTLNVESIHCDDPQFLEVFIVFLHKEIAICRQICNNYEIEGKKVKARVCVQISLKKELKEKIKNTKESVLTLITINQKLEKCIKKTINCINLIKVNIDDRYRVNLLEMAQYQILLDEYKSTWNIYHMQYEQFSMAKSRRKESIKWEYFYIDRIIIEHKIDKIKKILYKLTYIDWIRTQTMIIDLCRLLEKKLKKGHRLVNVKKNIYSYREEYLLIKAQLNKQHEEEAEQQRIRTQRLLEMPPPKMTLSHIYSNFIHKHQWTGIFEQWKQNKIASDTVSINSTLLEVMTINDEDASQHSKEHDHFEKQSDLFMSKQHISEINETICNDSSTNHSPNIEIKQIQTKNKRLNMSDKKEQLALVLDNGNESDQGKQQFLLSQAEVKRKEADKYFTEASDNTLNSEENVWTKKLPQIKKVENVHFDIPKQKHTRVNTTNLFSSHHYEYCNSNLTELLQTDTQNKEDFSSYEEPLHNFKLSECSNISPILNVEADKNTEVQNATDSINEKESLQENDEIYNSPEFNFSNVLKKKLSHFQIF